MTPSHGGKYLPKDQIEVTEVHGDLSQEVVRITVDRLRLILHQHLAALERRREWMAPAGILATLMVTFATTSFKDWLLSAATWQAGFVISTLLVVVWLARSVYRALRSESVEDLVDRIKQQRK